jgi:hypothetical protein
MTCHGSTRVIEEWGSVRDECSVSMVCRGNGARCTGSTTDGARRIAAHNAEDGGC